MKIIPVLFLVAFCAPMLRGQNEKQMSVDELVQKNIDAKGGAAALQSLQTVKLTGKMLVNEGQMELGFSEVKKRPDAVRSEVSLQGMTAVQAYDGKNGWKIFPFQGRKDPEKMSADDLKSLMEEAEVGGPLADAKASGSTVEYLGREDVDGTDAYKLKVTRKNGAVDFVYLDPDYFLEIRIISQHVEHGAQVETETDLSDYEKVNGVYLPFAVDSGKKGASDKQKIIIDKGDANPPVDDSIFAFPTTPAK